MPMLITVAKKTTLTSPIILLTLDPSFRAKATALFLPITGRLGSAHDNGSIDPYVHVHNSGCVHPSDLALNNGSLGLSGRVHHNGNMDPFVTPIILDTNTHLIKPT